MQKNFIYKALMPYYKDKIKAGAVPKNVYLRNKRRDKNEHQFNLAAVAVGPFTALRVKRKTFFYETKREICRVSQPQLRNKSLDKTHCG